MEQDWDLHAVVRGCSSTHITSSTTTTTTPSSSSSGFGNCCYFYNHESASSSSSSSCGGGGGFSSVFDCDQGIITQQQVLSSLPNNVYNYPFEDAINSNNPIEELHELCKPFFTTKSQPHQQFQPSSPLSSSFSYSSLPAPPPKQAQIQVKQQQEQQEQQQQQRSKNVHPGGSVSTPRSKRRKNQLKRVCQVPVENLSSDIWAWRKYGQKPIKGSPYPRGYYRCSSSKGCLARKQVERNRTDPTMFIVTYTSEHNHPAPTHRNSLAGSTRQKPLTPQSAAAAATGGGESETEKALAKPAASPVTPVAEEEEAIAEREKSESREEEKEDLVDDDEEVAFGVCDMVLPDDFFENLDELDQFNGTDAVINGGDCFIDPFSSMAMPSWVANSAAATAAGGSC